MCAFNISDFQLVKEFDMPSPMTFKEEGGVSLSPDGTKFIAVSGVIDFCLSSSHDIVCSGWI